MVLSCDAPDHCWHGDDYTTFCCCCPAVKDTDEGKHHGD